MLHPTERREEILRDIRQADMANLIQELSEKYGVSEITVRRDLKALEEKGFIKRTWGGAIPSPTQASGAAMLSRIKRQQLNVPQKTAIARYAAEHCVQDGDIIIMEGGTTATAMAPFLERYEELTAVTNGLYTTEALQCHLAPSATIICASGLLQRESSTFVGPVAEHFFHEFHGQKLFLSATGLSLETGITDPNMFEVKIKRAMLDATDNVFLLLDSTKFGVQSLMTVLELNDVTFLITDEAAPLEMVEALQAWDVEIVIVPSL